MICNFIGTSHQICRSSSSTEIVCAPKWAQQRILAPDDKVGSTSLRPKQILVNNFHTINYINPYKLKIMSLLFKGKNGKLY